MDQRISPEELRNAARFVEETSLDVLDSLSSISFPSVIGDLKEFPRPAPEDQDAEQGVAVLRRDIEDAVAALRAIAAARDNDLPVPPALLAAVQPYIDAFRRVEGQPPSENGPNQTEGNTTT